MSWVCAALSDFDFSGEDSSSSEEDEKIKRKKGNCTRLFLKGKSSRNGSDSNVSDDLSFKSLSSKLPSLRMLCATKIIRFARFSVRTKS
jgi:hypothetical protein